MKRQSCHYIETSQVICRANQLTGFYMMPTLVFNELIFMLASKFKPTLGVSQLDLHKQNKRFFINFLYTG